MGFFKSKQRTDPESELEAAYISCFSGPAGDTVINDLYLRTGMHGSIFADPDVNYDPIRAAHQDGMQRVVKRILNLSGKIEKVFK